MVRPVLEYASPVWDPTQPSTLTYLNPYRDQQPDYATKITVIFQVSVLRPCWRILICLRYKLEEVELSYK